jgi:hypothetical protein
MNPNGQPQVEVDFSAFHEARVNYPPELLLPYAGQHIAWSPDGSRVLVSGKDLEEVDRKLQALGIHWGHVVHDYVEDL